VLTRSRLDELGGKWGRYLDVDGDAIPWRTLPGPITPMRRTSRAARVMTIIARYSERPEDYKRDRRPVAEEADTARKFVPKPVIDRREGAKIGSSPMARPIFRSRKRGTSSNREGNRDRLLPASRPARSPRSSKFVAEHERVYVVEQNRDGQMADLIRLEVGEEQGRSEDPPLRRAAMRRPFHHRRSTRARRSWKA
jgi:2-oxoglutarate/2-oxoacid ferredoxin oxidoreductase subunit alpha